MGVLEQFDGGREKGGQGKTRQTLGRVETREKPVMAHRGSELRNCDGVFKNPVAIPAGRLVVEFDLKSHCICEIPSHSERQFGIVIL